MYARTPREETSQGCWSQSREAGLSVVPPTCPTAQGGQCGQPEASQRCWHRPRAIWQDSRRELLCEVNGQGTVGVTAWLASCDSGAAVGFGLLLWFGGVFRCLTPLSVALAVPEWGVHPTRRPEVLQDKCLEYLSGQLSGGMTVVMPPPSGSRLTARNARRCRRRRGGVYQRSGEFKWVV